MNHADAMEHEYNCQEKLEELINQIIKIAKEQAWGYEIDIRTFTNRYTACNEHWKGYLHRDDHRINFKNKWIHMAVNPNSNDLELYKGTSQDGRVYFVWASDWVRAVERLEKNQLCKLEMATNAEKKNLVPHIEDPAEVIWVEK